MDNSTRRRKMVQLQYELRAFVEKMSDGKLKCQFCGQLFSATTSITRFKWHWSKVEGRGVKTCDRVTTEIQEAAFQSIQQASNKKRKLMPSSRNMNDVIQAIPTTQEEINEGNNLVGDLEMIRMEEGQPGEERASPSAEAAGNHMENMIGGMTQPIDRSFSPDRVIVHAHEPRGDTQQQNNEIENSAGDEGMIHKEVQGTEKGVGEGRTTSCAHETRGDARQVIEMLSQVDLEMAEGGEALSPGALAWMDIMTGKDIELILGCTSPEERTLDAPETRPRTEPMHQDCEATTIDSLSFCMEDNALENPTIGLMQHFEGRSSPERLTINLVQPQEDSSQPIDLLCFGIGRHSAQLCSSSLNNDVIMNDVRNMIRGPGQHVVRGISHERLPVNQDEPREERFGDVWKRTATVLQLSCFS